MLAAGRGRNHLDVVEHIEVHVVLHVVERGPHRDRLCQAVGQQGVVTVVVDVPEVVGREQAREDHVTQPAEIGDFFTVHIFFSFEYTFP